MTRAELEKLRYAQMHKTIAYKLCHYSEFDYDILHNIMYLYRAGRGDNNAYNDVIIMADTETSKKDASSIAENHVCAWTISIRAFDMNIVTLYGHKPSTMIETMLKIHNNMAGDRTIIYFHNFSYDYVFLRKFMFKEWGIPVKILNVKPHYPILMEFINGLIFKDSLILAQRSLDKWAKDMGAEHQKAVGKWDYDKIRTQAEVFSPEELEYIEHDTLAGVECIQKTKDALNKKIYAMPYTATGIPREEVRQRGKEYHAHDAFLRHHLDYDQYLKALKTYHGGYTHSNRHYLNTTINEPVTCYDFASSYPYCMLSEKFPGGKFRPYHNTSIKTILTYADKYAFMFKLIMIKPRLKSDSITMPALQLSKCTKVINPVTDNGRILCAEYAEIYLTELDLEVIAEQYDYEKHLCTDVELTTKRYLPAWLTKYIYQLFVDKTQLKDGDKVLYSLAKARLNSIYGMCCQRSVKQEILEDYETGLYSLNTDIDEAELYEKYVKRYTSVLLYQIGVWVTAAAFRNLHALGKCVDYENGGKWLYSDTDSIYATKWNEERLNAYNENCKRKLLNAGYGAVKYKDKDYWLGVATLDKEASQFRYQGAKRYCYRSTEDNELHITVAGVPKKASIALKDNIDNFAPGFIFPGTVSGKKTHTYFYVEDIYNDSKGNETGDSIDLSPCDYLLDSVDTYDWEKIFTEEIEVQTYEDM